MPRETNPKTPTNGASANGNGAAKAPTNGALITDPYEWIAKQTTIKSSNDVPVSATLIEQVIGQDHAVAAAQKAAGQKRHLLLIGDPGTGKSMIAKAMSEMLPPEKLSDVMSYHNAADPNQPRIASVDAGKGPTVLTTMRRRARRRKVAMTVIGYAAIGGLLGLGIYMGFFHKTEPDIMAFGVLTLAALFAFMIFKQRKDSVVFAVPKLLIGHDPKKETHAAYVDGTGSHAGALLGDVRHDPFQSGGLETPTHERVEIGAIHRAHKGILFIDEINVLRLDSQQSLLTAMQDRQYSIVGQSETSSGAMVRTDPVPCEFILVAAGNLDAVQPPDGVHKGMHPALRSRIRGYGYEVYVNSSMPDTHDNRLKLCRFVAQEVTRDGRIPHFERDAIAEVILEGQRRSGQRGKLTLRLRELGGLVRTAGDIAQSQGRKAVTSDDVRRAKILSRSLEQQIAQSALDARHDHDVAVPSGTAIGRAVGAGVVGTGEVGEPAGLMVPIAAVVTPPISRQGGHIEFGGGIEDSGKTQCQTVASLLKTLAPDVISTSDIHLQSLVPQEGVDATACGVALAVSAISALRKLPVRQDVVLIGGLAVGGGLRAVRGVTQQIESAVDNGYNHVVVPSANRNDVLLNQVYKDRVQISFVGDLEAALALATNAPTVRVVPKARPKAATGA
ncbi:MAG: ATP-dependent protease LonB [bacterium]